jgi:hypothetical protein
LGDPFLQVNGNLQDRVIGVEIAVRQVVAHACDLAPPLA